MPPLDMTQLRPGTKIVLDDQLWVVTDYAHTKPGKGSPFVTAKLKNMIDGRVVERTFRGASERIMSADVSTRNASFVYSDDMGFHFMDIESYEQFMLATEFVGDKKRFLLPEGEVQVQFWNDSPIGLTLPLKMVCKIVDTIDNVDRGNSSGNITKDATIETGFVVQVPAFIKNGETIRVNTETGEYIERA